jgi:hypothetical protein
MTSTIETTETAPVTKATKKAAAGARRAKVAPAKPKPGKEGHPEEEGATKRAKRRPPSQHFEDDCGLAALPPGGASAKDLLKATSWQPHSLRGFISGTLGKKMGLTVTSTKGEDGERRYAVKA